MSLLHTIETKREVLRMSERVSISVCECGAAVVVVIAAAATAAASIVVVVSNL